MYLLEHSEGREPVPPDLAREKKADVFGFSEYGWGFAIGIELMDRIGSSLGYSSVREFFGFPDGWDSDEPRWCEAAEAFPQFQAIMVQLERDREKYEPELEQSLRLSFETDREIRYVDEVIWDLRVLCSVLKRASDDGRRFCIEFD